MTAGYDDAMEAMTIHQLVERTSVPARRIRHYIAVGLLPPPTGRGRAAHYSRVHVERLHQIQALRDVNLSLEEIQQRLGPVSEADGSTMDVPGPEPWQRWQVVPGIELHVRSDLGLGAARMARVLAGVARQLLAEHGMDTPEGE